MTLLSRSTLTAEKGGLSVSSSTCKCSKTVLAADCQAWILQSNYLGKGLPNTLVQVRATALLVYSYYWYPLQLPTRARLQKWCQARLP